MLSYEIDECQDIEALRQQCKKDWDTLALISETLVDYSKCHITAEKALKEIRKYIAQGLIDRKQRGHHIRFCMFDEESGKENG
jgi:hypothetical protein